MNQLIYVANEIYKSFDDGYKVRRIFLHIPKVFDKVLHLGLYYKLKHSIMSGKLSNTLTNYLRQKNILGKLLDIFLENRTQKVTQVLTWRTT